MTKALYLSYDGMTDPLGGSQILPYLAGLARRGHDISLISFEKMEDSGDKRETTSQACRSAGIEWHPLPYHKRPPVLSTIYDVRQMSRLAERLHADQPFELLHCRSYLSALAGLRMKRRFGVPFLFDMRGFWADERVEGGIWKLSNPALRAVYHYFKRREAEFLDEAAHIVSLTEAGKDILLKRRMKAGPPITVIPCCVDLDAFPPVRATDRKAARERLGIAEGARVAAYLGSIGSWYMGAEMMDFFRVQLERAPDSRFLVVSPQPEGEILALAASRGVPGDQLLIQRAARSEVPGLLAAADYGLFFIMPVFSKQASSPTKMGEFLAMELPIVTNDGVGDVSRIVGETGAGVTVDRFDDAAYGKALAELEKLNPDMDRWRSAARRWFDLEHGVERYDGIYKELIRGG